MTGQLSDKEAVTNLAVRVCARACRQREQTRVEQAV